MRMPAIAQAGDVRGNSFSPQDPSSFASASASTANSQHMDMPAQFDAVPPSAAVSASLVPFPNQQQQPDFEALLALPAFSPMPQHRASSGAWTLQDDRQLMTARMQGFNWGQIKDAFFPTKSANACRKRHERLMDYKAANDWSGRKFRNLAREYMNMRREIWSGLAARTGEKWTVVEHKCMAIGLRNLTGAARSCARYDSFELDGPIPGYDDDSGIFGTGLTPLLELDASHTWPEPGSANPPPRTFLPNCTNQQDELGLSRYHNTFGTLMLQAL